MRHIKSFNNVNESVPHNGIVLIKGKPKGKNKEQKLYAGHVIGSSELRPGAVMLFLSDQFYRIIKDDDRLKGIRINYRDEDSLKDSLSFKSPGKISLVRNNNKTPYHWKTLKETSISQALDKVRGDLGGSDYLFESVDTPEITGNSLFEKVLSATIDSILGENKSIFVLSYSADNAEEIGEFKEDENSEEVPISMSFECLCVDHNLCKEIEAAGESKRFSIEINLNSNLVYHSWTIRHIDYPDDTQVEIEEAENKVEDLWLHFMEEPSGFDYTPYYRKIENYIGEEKALEWFISKKHFSFTPYWV